MVLISYYIAPNLGTPYGQRIWEDGRVENFRTSRRVKSVDGSIRTEALAPDWYPITLLSESQVEAIWKAVETSGVGEMPTVVESEMVESDDLDSAEWQVATAGGLKTIRFPIWNPADARQRPLLTLIQKMGEIVLAAQNAGG